MHNTSLFMLYRTIEGLLYTCGSTLKGVQVVTQSRTELPVVKEKVYVRENIACSDPVEIPYYSSEKFQSICTHCECECDVDIEGQYPLCEYCRDQGQLPNF